MKENENSFYTIKEFAEKLRMHPNSIRKAIKNGRISALQLGGKARSSYRIPNSELSRLVVIDIDVLVDREIEKRKGLSNHS